MPIKRELKKAIPAAAIIALFLVLSINTLSHVAPTLPQSEAVELGTARAYELIQYGTYVYWSQTIYAQNVEFYSNRIAFTNATFGGQNASSFSFGLGSEYANATIVAINSTSVSIHTSAMASGAGSSFLFFYFPNSHSPKTILLLENSSASKITLLTGDFYTNAGSFASASAPAAFLNETNSIMTLKLNGASTIVFSDVLLILTTSSSSSSASPSTVTSPPTTISTTSSSVSTSTSSSTSQLSSTPEAWWAVVYMSLATVVVIAGVLFFLRKKG